MKKTTTFYIVRHGETVWNVERRMQGRLDSPLTVQGVKHVELLSEKMSSYRFDAVFSSPTGRAFKTAQLLIQGRNIEVEKKDCLLEIDLGRWEGLTSVEINKTEKEMYSNFWEKPHHYYPDKGESFFDIKKRVTPFIQELLSEYKGKAILIVTHTTIVKTILFYFENRQVENFWQKPVIYPASLSLVEVDEDSSAIKLYGDISHYEKLLYEKDLDSKY